jgi:GAF domain-containing protein
MTDEDTWSRDKRRFVEDAEHAREQHRQPLPDHGSRLGPLAREFAVLTYSLVDASTVAEVVEQVVDTAKRVIPAADMVSVTLRDGDGSFHTPVQTEEAATGLDRLQYEFGEGPCVDSALEEGPAVAHSRDLAVESSWPRFGPAAAERGMRSVLSTALLPSAGPASKTGSLNIYRRMPGGFTEEEKHTALLLATHAALALARTDAVEIGRLKETHLRRALDSRDVIGQAKGILMQRQGVDASAAFDILRSTSQELNVKLVTLAETLTARHRELDR